MSPQGAILKAFKNLVRFRQEAKFTTWLIQIAINEAKMKLRKDRRHLMNRSKKDDSETTASTLPKILQTGEKYHPRRWNRKSFARRSPRPGILFMRNTAPY